MLSKFSGSRQDLQFVLFLVILLSVLGISLFIAVSMGLIPGPNLCLPIWDGHMLLCLLHTAISPLGILPDTP